MNFLKKPIKGKQFYIRDSRRMAIVRTALMFLLAVGIYLLGYLTLKTTKSVWSVFAVLSLLPASKSAVNLIMFLRAKKIPEDFYKKVEKQGGDSDIMYDLIFTTYEKTYQVDALLCKCKNIIAYSQTDNKSISDLEAYIKKNILKDTSFSLKIYNQEEAFLKRAGDMCLNLKKEKDDNSELFDSIRAVIL
ncbi:MAG: hypothetical protein K5931_06290 [Lachnospiraceae bacterium]|nr:hypothetical protein [Lachnospiraceae bacterium]